MVDINITYETLYDLLRTEKNRDDIQELPPAFFSDVIIYLKKNVDMLDEAITKRARDDVKEDFLRQIKNIKNIIRELYERREKKIINLAINRSRTHSDSIETEMLLPQEKEMYEQFVRLMDKFRAGILSNTVNCVLPSLEKEAADISGKQQTYVQPTLVSESASADDEPSMGTATDDNLSDDEISGSTEINAVAKEVNEITSSFNKKIKFKENVPKFLGKELEVYGPYEPEDTATLPTELANILIGKGKAEEIIN